MRILQAGVCIIWQVYESAVVIAVKSSTECDILVITEVLPILLTA